MGTITDILTPLLAQADQIVAIAEARADKAEADRAEAKRLIAMAAAIFANDDDDDAVEQVAEVIDPQKTKSAEKASSGKPVRSIAKAHSAAADFTCAQPSQTIHAQHTGKADSDIIAAMVGAWMTALAIWKAIGGDAAPISRAAVYQRMPLLVARHPELIEQHPDKNEWRLKTPAPQTSNDNPPVESVVLEPLALNTLHHGDGLELMKRLPDQSVDLILCDPPFGTCNGTSKSGKNIDVPLNQAALWREYQRIIKPQGNILLFGSDPFSTEVINAAPGGWFKYRNIWKKNKPTGEFHANNKPLKDYEDIMVFTPANNCHARDPNGPPTRGTTANRATYNAWSATKILKRNKPKRSAKPVEQYMRKIKKYDEGTEYWRLNGCPRMVIECAKEKGPNECGGRAHPYQKPQILLNDLIRRYSNAGEIVLDNCAGSGSTAVAAINSDRQWIAIEMDDDWFEQAGARINAVLSNKARLAV